MLWKTSLRRLERRCPLPLYTEVRFTPGYSNKTGLLASCLKKGGRQPHFLIIIDPDPDDDTIRYLLIHEWAHALSWGQEDCHHGPLWGVAFSKCYRVAIERMSR